jgi:hypothetical protein
MFGYSCGNTNYKILGTNMPVIKLHNSKIVDYLKNFGRMLADE